MNTIRQNTKLGGVYFFRQNENCKEWIKNIQFCKEELFGPVMIRCWFAQGQGLVQQSIRNLIFVKKAILGAMEFLLELSLEKKMRLSCSCCVYFTVWEKTVN